jgi:branched-chain amino acid transport system substrate-binding protein
MNKKSIILILLVAGVAFVIYLFLKNKSYSNNEKVVINVGVIAPLSGENATYGDATIRGLEMALAAISKKEEYKNFRFTFVKEDSKLEASKAVSCIQKLISVDKVPVIIGPFGSSEVLAVSQSANQGSTPIVSASATADAIATAGDYVFRIVPSNKEQGTSMADFVVNNLKIRDSITILALNNDYGVSLSASFKNRLTEIGGKIVYEDKFDEKVKDFKTLIAKVKTYNPKFIYLPDHYNEAGLFLKQAHELGLNCQIGGGDGSYSPDLITIAGKGAEGFCLTLMGMDNLNPNTKAFNDAFKNKYNQNVDVYSAYAYDVLFVIADALKNLNKEELKKINGDIFRTLLYKQNYVGITGNNQFDINGEVKKAFVIYQVINNQFIILK